MTDHELLQLLRQRSPIAFKELHKFLPMCRKRILELGIPEEDSKDIFQDSIIVLYEKAQRTNFSLTSKISTFLYAVCQNKALEALRKQNKKTPFKEEYAEGITLNKAEENESEENKPILPSEEEIKEAINRLGAPCNEILAAFYYHKASIKEISEKHGYKNENTARQAKFKCIKRLKKLYLSKYHD